MLPGPLAYLTTAQQAAQVSVVVTVATTVSDGQIWLKGVQDLVEKWYG